jgi:hypothetical protein
LPRHPAGILDHHLWGDVLSGLRRFGPADRIFVSTGQQPDVELTRELRPDPNR